MAEPIGVSGASTALTVDSAKSWEQTEAIAKILSLIAIPIVLAVVGWFVQSSLSAQTASQEYVKLSVSILKEPKDKVEPSLRSWAADLLNTSAPTKLSPQALQALKEGTAILPTQLTALLSKGSDGASLAVSPDGARVATGHSDGSARLWDARSGRMLRSFQEHEAPVTSIAFSPDGKSILTGSLDKVAKLLDLSTGNVQLALRGHTEAIIGVAFAPSGTTIFTRSLDKTIRSWSLDGQALSSFHLPD
ncbi:WD40 repeat domain-containing protein [Bradyrhizobium sp. SZCCHNRI1009]|uniref:WD40 repeat domain-containing protein n=1 Tax=Bradyrhizobium sp. SZCCHNRI1009 TaxID=3057277 RepID=UPI003966B16B